LTRPNLNNKGQIKGHYIFVLKVRNKYISNDFFPEKQKPEGILMAQRSTLGIIGLIILSTLMFVFSFLYYQHGETLIPLLLIFAGLILAAILAIIVLFPEKSENKEKE